MHNEKNFSSRRQPEQSLTELDQALNYIAAAVANLHEAAQHLKNCNAARLTENIIRAREEIRKSWRGVQQIRHTQGHLPDLGDVAVHGEGSPKRPAGG